MLTHAGRCRDSPGCASLIRVEPTALVLGLSGTGLAVARALGRRGVRVLGVDPSRAALGRFSRYVRASTELTVDALRALAEDARPVLFACGDPEFSWALDHREALASFTRLPGAIATGAAEAALDKRRLYRRCQELGVLLPTTWLPEDDGDVATVAREARWPVLVKPACGHDGGPRLRKLTVCASGDALRRAVPDPRAVVLQELIPGPESALLVFAAHVGRDGRAGPTVTARKLRQYPAGTGSGTAVVTERDDEVAERSLLLIEALGLHGPCGVEWKRAGGRLWHIEVNPRPVLWYALAEAVVVDAWHELRGEPRPPPVPQRDGVRWQYLTRDLVAGGRRAWPLGHVLCEAAPDDPLPGLWSPVHAASQWLGARGHSRR